MIMMIIRLFKMITIMMILIMMIILMMLMKIMMTMLITMLLLPISILCCLIVFVISEGRGPRIPPHWCSRMVRFRSQ